METRIPLEIMPNSGVTAGSYGPSADATPGYGATFVVPYLTVDAKGRVTEAFTRTIKIPASDNTDTKVTQTVTTTSAEYPLLAKNTTATSTITDTSRFAAGVTVNPSTKTITATKFKGSLEGNADSATEFAAAESVTLTGDVTGSASSKAGWSVATTLSNSGVTANTYGSTTQQTPAHGATFDVPYVTVDAKGRITSAGTSTVKLPTDQNTDTKVTQTVSTDNAELPLLAKDSNGTTTTTASSKFAAAVKLNPSTGTVTATKFAGDVTNGTLGTASRAVVTDSNKKLTVSSVTSTELGYVSGVTSSIQTQLNGKAASSHEHSADDITSGTLADARIPNLAAGKITSGTFNTARIPNLDASKITSGTIDIARLPSGALERLVVVADQAARFALTSSDVQLGDTVKQEDTGVMYYVKDTSSLDSEDGYEEYSAGTATSVPWSGVTGKPSTFPPSSHTHASNDVTAMTGYSKPSSTSAIGTSDTLNSAVGKLEKALDGKAPTSHASTATTYGVSSATNYGHAMATSTTPIVAGTAAVGSETAKFARGDHVHPAQTSVSGNAGTATKFASNQTVALTGDVTGSASSQAGWSVATTLSNSGVTADTYGSTTQQTPAHGATFEVPYVTVDAKGRVTAAGTSTVKLPADQNTDTKVTQTVSTDNAELPLLAKDSNGTTTTTATSKFAAAVKLNPSTGTVTATKFSGPLAGNASSATEFSAAKSVTLTGDVTGTASSKAGWSVATTLSDSGVTAGTIGETSQQTPTHGGTFNIPYVTVDTKGRVTAGGTTTVKLPTDSDTNTKVTQTVTTTSGEYPILAKNTTATATITDTSRFASGVTLNPSTGTITATKFKGATEGNADTATKAKGVFLVIPNETAQTATLTATVEGITEYFPGLTVALRMPFASAASSTLNINSLGAKPIYYNNNTASANYYPANSVVILVYETTTASTGCWKMAYSYDSNTNNATAQNISTSNNTYPILIAYTANATANIGNKATYFCKDVKINPSTGIVSANGFSGPISGNADTATKFASAQSVTLTGDVTGTASSQAGWSVATTLSDSGVTAGTIGNTSQQTPAHGGTFNIPYVTVDSKGRVTAGGTTTVKLPTDSDTNTKVTQTVSTDNAELPLLAKASNGTTTVTDTSKFAAAVKLNPSTGTVTATKFSGDGSGLTALNGSQVTSGTVAAARIASLDASKIGSGTFNTARIPSLDASKITSGTIDIARLPSGALERLVVVADETARYALTIADVQLGDTVKQEDTGVMYYVKDTDHLDSAAGYEEYTAGAATSVPWSGVTGKPSSFTPSSHTHGNISNSGTLATANAVVVTDGDKKVLASTSVTTTELSYLDGVTSAIQTQLNGKAPTSHASTATTYGVSSDANYGHAMASSTTPIVAGTAAVGSETAKFARGDHVHPAQTSVSGNAGSATKLATARTIDGVDFNGTAAISHYGSCSTAAGTAEKAVAVTSYKLVTGSWVAVKFTVTNTAANPTLNVNSTGAKAIYYRGAAVSAGYLAANRTYLFVYNGTQYDLIGDLDTNTTYSAGTGLSLSSNQFSLSDSGITAGTIGETSQQTPSHGGTFNIPYVTVDAKGRLTAGGTTTVKLPADQNTDTKVTQTVSTDNAELPILAKASNATSTVTDTSKFAATVKINPSTGNLTATKFTGDGTGINIGSTANLPLITTTDGKISAGSFGTAANTFCQGNDSRLSDSRTPKSHTHGNITNAGAIGSTANLPVITTTSGVLTTGSFGTGANTFCQGNDSRLSNARTPTAHASTATTYGVSSDTNYGHAMASSTTPIVAGTAAVGSETAKFARGDHVHPEQTLVNKTRGVFLVIPTQTSQTATLTATVDGITEYFPGLTIAYRAPFNTAASSTLNINSLGAKPIYYKVNTTSKDYYPANTVILLVYETTTVSTGCWKMVFSYDGNNNNYDRRLHNQAVKAAAAVTAGTVIVGTSSGYKQAASGITFDLQYPILYASAAIAANATATNTYEAIPSISLATTKSGWTGTQYAMAFLVGTLSGTTVTIDSAVFTTTIPNSADGKIYIPIGLTYSTTQVFFAPTKDVYHYTNGSFHLYDPTTVASGTESLSWNTSVTLATVNGTAIKAKLPANPDTDSKVAVTLGTTTKAYLLGTSTTPISTAQGVTSIADTGVYLDTTAGNLTATKFNGDGTGLNIGSTANLPLITTTNGKISAGSFGTAANTFCQGNDSRLSNARTPTAHASTATTYGVSSATNYGHAMASSDTPLVAGTANVGTDNGKFARGDHVHPAQTSVSGNAGSATKLATARTIDGVDFDGSAAISHYGSCSTAAATAEKAVSVTSYKLVTGSWVAVKFTVTNTAVNPTLNVNSTGAKAIYYRGSAIAAGNLAANRTYLFVYNGTQYELIGDIDTNSNTDTLMTQNVSTTNATYPILAVATADATANLGAKTGIFGSGVKINPSTSALSANQYVANGMDGIRFRQSGSNKYTSLIRNDGGSTYWLLTNANDPDGTWNSFRPLTINNSTGACSISGNAATSTKFASAQSVTLTGDVTGTASSQAGWSVATTLANSGVTAGTYSTVTVDAKGRVTAGNTKHSYTTAASAAKNWYRIANANTSPIDTTKPLHVQFRMRAYNSAAGVGYWQTWFVDAEISGQTSGVHLFGESGAPFSQIRVLYENTAASVTTSVRPALDIYLNYVLTSATTIEIEEINNSGFDFVADGALSASTVPTGYENRAVGPYASGISVCSNADYAVRTQLNRVNITANATLADNNTYRGNVLNCTGNITITVPSINSAWSWFIIKNANTTTGNITIHPSSTSVLIDGSSDDIILRPKECILIQSKAANAYTIVFDDRKRTALVGRSGEVGSQTKHWFLVAETTCSSTYSDPFITFKVFLGTGTSLAGGVLSAHARIDTTKGVVSSKQLQWEYKDDGINIDDFAITNIDTSGTSTKIQIWWKSASSYSSCKFVVLGEHEQSDALDSKQWILTRARKTEGDIVDFSSGFTGSATSTLLTISNPMSGNAGTATTLATARYIDGVSFNGSADLVHYGTCSTAAGTAAKTVACTGYALKTGGRILVKFTNTNTAANATLNVNSTGAKAIYVNGAAIAANRLQGGTIYEFVYNGTQYDLVDGKTSVKYTSSDPGSTVPTDLAEGGLLIYS